MISTKHIFTETYYAKIKTDKTQITLIMSQQIKKLKLNTENERKEDIFIQKSSKNRIKHNKSKAE